MDRLLALAVGIKTMACLRWPLAVAVLVAVAAGESSVLHGQTAADQPAAAAADKPAVAAADKPAVAADGGQVQRWVAELDHDSFRTREEATRRLIASGGAALDPLAKAAARGGPEVAWRAVVVLKGIWGGADEAAAQRAFAVLEKLASSPDSPVADDAANVLKFGASDHLARLGIDLGGQPLDGVTALELDESFRGESADLRFLKFLPNLGYLRISKPSLGDAALDHVARLPALERLDVYGNGVSAGAIEKLQKARTGLAVYWFGRAILGIHGREQAGGCLVVGVSAELGAAKAGVRAGDVITKLNDKKIDSFATLTRRLASHKAGDVIQLEINRNGETIKPKVTLSPRSDAPAVIPQFFPGGVP